MADKNKTIARNTVFLTIRMIFVLVVSLYTSRVFLNALGVVDYGISNVVAGFVSMFTFLNSALINAIQRYYSFELGQGDKASFQRIYTTSIIIQVLLAVIVVFLLETVGLWYINYKMVIPTERVDAARWVFQFSVLSSFFVILRIPYSSAILSYERMDFYALSQMLDVTLKLLLALCLPYYDSDKLILYGGVYCAISILGFLIDLSYSKIKFNTLKLNWNLRKSTFVDMLTFSGWNFFGTLACMAREQGLNMILNLFFGPVVNAARGVAYQVSSALQGFVNNIGIAAKPQMIQSFAEGNQNRTIKLMYSMSKISFIILFYLAVPVCLEINSILHFWLGDAVPEHSHCFVILVILTSFMNNLNAPLSNVVYATGKMRDYELTFSIINLLILPISYFALKNGACPEAVFVIYFVMSIFVQLGCLIVLKKIVRLSLKEYFLELIKPILVMAFIAIIPPLVILNIIDEGVVRILSIGVTSLVSTSLCSYYICLNSSERELVNVLFNKLITKVIKR